VLQRQTTRSATQTSFEAVLLQFRGSAYIDGIQRRRRLNCRAKRARFLRKWLIVAAVAIGVLGNVVWESFKPGLGWLGQLLLNLISLWGIKSQKDGIYSDIARGLHERSSGQIEQMLIALASVVILFLGMLLWRLPQDSIQSPGELFAPPFSRRLVRRSNPRVLAVLSFVMAGFLFLDSTEQVLRTALLIPEGSGLLPKSTEAAPRDTLRSGGRQMRTLAARWRTLRVPGRRPPQQ
jgi:hypothetical protein